MKPSAFLMISYVFFYVVHIAAFDFDIVKYKKNLMSDLISSKIVKILKIEVKNSIIKNFFFSVF